MAEFPSIVHEFWQAFAEERLKWVIAEPQPGIFIATDRNRFCTGDAFVNPIEETSTFIQEVCPSREAAAYFIGINSVAAAMIKTGIIHADA